MTSLIIQKFSASTNEFLKEEPLTPELLDTLAEFNGYLRPHQIAFFLGAGDAIYTSFNYYKKK